MPFDITEQQIAAGEYVTCAIATDGGSIEVVVDLAGGRRVSLVLDRQIGTSTPERIYLSGLAGGERVLLEPDQERPWLRLLRRLTAEGAVVFLYPASKGPMTDLWSIRRPSYDTDYAAMNINGRLRQAYSLPAISCNRCGDTWASFDLIPHSCPDELKALKVIAKPGRCLRKSVSGRSRRPANFWRQKRHQYQTFIQGCGFPKPPSAYLRHQKPRSFGAPCS